MASAFVRWRSTVFGLMPSSEGDLLTAPRLGDQLDDLDLPGRERVPRLHLAVSGSLHEVTDQRRDARRVEEGLAPHGRADRLDEVAVGGRLQDISRGAVAQRFEQVLLVVVHGEHQDPQFRAQPLELGCGLEARPARHRDVEDREVDRGVGCALHRFGAVARLRDDLEVGLAVDHQPQPAADHGVVVGDQDPGDQRDRHDAGSSTTTSVPPEARARTSTRPAGEQRALAHAADPAPAPSPTPRPSSATRRTTAPFAPARSTVTCREPEWRTALVRASCAIR